MLDGKILDGLKLVTNEEYYATDAEVEFGLETCFQQASQAWGIRRDQGILLRMARELKLAQSIAQKAQADDNKMKGLQLANGRLKKQIAVLEGTVTLNARTIEDIVKENDVLEDRLTALSVAADALTAE